MLGRGTAEPALSGAKGQRDSGTALAWLASVLRRVSGMPDYQGYVEHIRRSHPDMAPLTEREYYAEYLRTRYSDGPTRCC